MSDDEGQDEGQGGAASKAKQEEEEVEEARRQMEEIQEGEPPGDLADWPGGKAKYQTYGGPEGESGYEDGATSKLGPSSLRHHEDGKVTIEGEEVDDPSEYKGEPIPGGPSDPDAPPDPAMIGNEEEDSDDEDSGSEARDDDGSESEDDASPAGSSAVDDRE